MSEEVKEMRDGSFLCVNEKGKAYWGQPEGYPYKIEDKTTVLENTALPFTYQGLSYGTDYANVSERQFVEGDTYIVNFDGTEYVCVCKLEYAPINRKKVLIIGNPQYGYNILADYNNLPNTGEPFLIANKEWRNGFEFRGPNKGTFTISIVHDKSKTYPMAPKFLPGVVTLYLDAEMYLYANETDTADVSKRLTYTKVRDMWLSGQNIVVTNIVDNEAKTMIIHAQIIGINVEKNKETNETLAVAISITGEVLNMVVDIKL